MKEMKIDKIKQVAEDIVDSVNKTDNDYDAREVVIKELIEEEIEKIKWVKLNKLDLDDNRGWLDPDDEDNDMDLWDYESNNHKEEYNDDDYDY